MPLVDVKLLAGFTLVEIMVSVIILGIGLVIIANSYIVALRGINTTANTICALNLARGKFEELESASLKDGLTISDATAALKSPTKNYDYTQKIVEIDQPENLAKNLLQACLNLNWQEQNVAKHVVLSTYLSKQKQ